MGHRDRRQDAGQGALGWVAMIAVAAIIVVAVAVAAHQEKPGRLIGYAVCRVGQIVGSGVADCGAWATPDGQTGDDTPQSDRPWYCEIFGVGCPDTPPKEPGQADVPPSLDPNSQLVKELQSTERGRATLQWLYDHHIPIEFRDDVTGAYWDGSKMVIGKGFDDPSVIVHETNHAKYTDEGRHADVDHLSRNDFIHAAIDEEADGLTQQIQAAKEFRAAGYDIGQQPAEGVYDAAYQRAKQNGASDAEAVSAGRAAVTQEFYNGGLVASTNGKSYPDFYGDQWDDAH